MHKGHQFQQMELLPSAEHRITTKWQTIAAHFKEKPWFAFLRTAWRRFLAGIQLTAVLKIKLAQNSAENRCKSNRKESERGDKDDCNRSAFIPIHELWHRPFVGSVRVDSAVQQKPGVFVVVLRVHLRHAFHGLYWRAECDAGTHSYQIRLVLGSDKWVDFLVRFVPGLCQRIHLPKTQR